jgi:hypothetical protein
MEPTAGQAWRVSLGDMHRPPQVVALIPRAVESIQEDEKGNAAWIFEKQEELRNKYALIRRGLSALRNAIEALTLMKSTGDPFFDDSEEARQKLIMIVEKAAHRATQSEIEALIAEYGPDARQVLA